MSQVSVGRVENLQDLVNGLVSVREALESACREQITAAESLCAEAREETQKSGHMLESACRTQQEAQYAVEEAQENCEAAASAINTARSALSACEAGGQDEDGYAPDCSGEEADLAVAEAVFAKAQAIVAEARAHLTQAIENRQRMEQRVEFAKQALAMAEKAFDQAQQECTSRMKAVWNAIEAGTTRLTAAQQTLQAYLSTNAPATHFQSWLNWHPEPGKPVTPDILRDRMNLSDQQQGLLQEYLYDRNSTYRNLVKKYRNQWQEAGGDVERNIAIRNARIILSGEFAEQIARHALASLGGQIQTQGRTFVGNRGKYTKTDFLVTGLRNPVIFGRGDGMGAPTGGSMAFEVKCGKAEYLYAQKKHMTFQAVGHKQADARCTLCSRDIHELPPEKEKELRDALRAAGSPLVGMLPAKNQIDKSCLDFIRRPVEEQK